MGPNMMSNKEEYNMKMLRGHDLSRMIEGECVQVMPNTTWEGFKEPVQTANRRREGLDPSRK